MTSRLGDLGNGVIFGSISRRDDGLFQRTITRGNLGLRSRVGVALSSGGPVAVLYTANGGCIWGCARRSYNFNG